MTEDMQELLARFEHAIASEAGADAPYIALQRLTEKLVGVKLFTIMTVDLEAGLARRAYSSDPVAYPASGVKPITPNAWFAVISEQRQPFIANTIEEIAEVFGDHELIASLGCGSVINLPVFVADQLLGTVNILHEPHYYTPERAARFVAHAGLPAKLAMLAAERQR